MAALALGHRRISLDRLREAPDNPRSISDDALDRLAYSLERQPDLLEPRPLIVTPDGEVLAGNMRLRAARRLGWSEIPTFVVEVDAAQRRQIVLMDNQSMGEWVPDQVVDMIRAHAEEEDADMRLLGFADAEVEEMLRASVPDEIRAPPEDVAPPAPEKPTTVPGEIVCLGSHRLICADATQPQTWSRLLGDERPACMWTDPPYGVNYEGGTADALKIEGDSEAGLGALLNETFAIADGHLAEGAAIYCAAPAGRQHLTFLEAFHGHFKLRSTLVWVKDSMVLGHSDYHYRHEDVIFGVRVGERIAQGYTEGGGRRGRGGDGWYGDNAQTTVFEVPRPKSSQDHPTQKPIPLVGQHLANSSRRGDVIVDPFAGSGTTLMAAAELERVARLIEVDPRYCDVIIQRWESWSGQPVSRSQS